MILLRRNSEKDISYDFTSEIKEGQLVAMSHIVHYSNYPASVHYIIPKGVYGDFLNPIPGNLNCFDYVPKREHPNYVK